MSDNIIEHLGKGAVRQPEDPRDLQAAFVLGAPVVDWSKEFRQPEPPNEDQGSSGSCVAQAWSYFHFQVHPLNWSRRDLYSRIFLPQSGAYLRDGGKQIKANGQATRDQAPDPSPETEAHMRSKDGITADMERIGLEADYLAVNGKSIDAVATAIVGAKGCVIGVEGTNAGWRDIANPRPPQDGDPGVIWGHALYCFGYHTHDGVKCVIAKSSWGDDGGTTVHHIKQNYFDSGFTFDGWTLIPKEQQPLYARYIVFHKPTGRQGILVVGETGFADAILWAKSEAMLADLKTQYEIPANAPTITLG